MKREWLPLDLGSLTLELWDTPAALSSYLASKPEIRVVLVADSQAARFSCPLPWIQVGGTARSARENGASAWVRTPVDEAELALALRPLAQELNLRSVLHRVEDSFVVVDFEWRYLYLNEAALALSDKPRKDFLGKTVWEVFPETLGSEVEGHLRQAMTSRQPSRSRRYSPLRGRTFEHRLYPVPQGLAVITSDVTDLVEAEKAAEAREKQLERFTEVIPQMVWVTGDSGTVDYLNQHWLDYTGLARESLSAKNRDKVIHPEDLTELEKSEPAFARKEAYEMELRLRRHDGAFRWHLVRAIPVKTETGTSWLGTATDIDDLKRAQQSLKFLAEASQILASSLDYRETLSAVVKLAVPELSDWASVDLVEHGELQQLAVAHTDPEKLQLVSDLTSLYPRSPQDPGGAYAVLRSGESQLVEVITPDLIRAAARDERHYEMITSLGLCSYICVPLKAGGRALGVISLASAENRRPFQARDLALAEELAARAALAIDNALLYRSSQEEVAARRRHEEKLRETQVALEKARDEAVRASRMKTAFLANMSHEIRTPMNGIRGMIEFLEELDLPAAHTEYISTIRECADSLLSILNDILDLSRIEAGKLEIKKTVFELPALIRKAHSLFKHMAEEKGLELQLELSDVPRWTEGDPDRLRQILVNLISNAVKFTESGSVRIVARDSPLTVEVIDTGMGISAEAQRSLFSPFSQGDASSSRKHQGAGLGLSIVWRLVQLMKGSVAVESAVGQGTRFTLTLPLEPAREPSEEVHSPLDTSRLEGLEVLVVEDNPINRRVLALQLDRLGCRVSCVEDGYLALAYLNGAVPRPEVILMDCQMPGLDGYETTRRLRALELKPRPLIVALTAHAMVGEREKCLAAGMDDYLSKPVSLERLAQILAGLAHRGAG